MKNTLVMLSWFCLLASSFAAERKPNIIIFLADDLGYAGVGANGCKDIPTPHIDSIAKNGVRFTDGYATHCVCSPSRAGLMSGRYQHRFGFEHNSGPERFAAENFGLPRTEPTLAECLKAAGYATGMVGKWHIGFKEGLRPHERGFDFHYGFLSGARTYLPGKADNDPLIRNGHPVTDEKEYLTDAFAREGVAFLDRSQDKPFFLYVAFNAVHAPMEATEPYLARFPNLTGTRRTHAGMVAAMDDAVGRVLGNVRSLGQEENTLIFFYSDNGGPTPQTTASNEPLRGYKGQFYEGGIRVPFLAQWKGKLPAGMVYREMVMGFDCHATALAAAGVPLPTDKPLDGVNLLPFLLGKQTGRPHDQLFWRAGEKHAARVGDWKLVQERGGEAQLFNLKDDISEATDLAAKEPAKLKELQAAYAAWDKQMMPAQWRRQDGRTQGAGKAPAKGAARGGGIEKRFKQYDKNGDGKLTPEEFPMGAFKQIDKNNDGVLTLDEVKAYYGGRRQKAKQEE
jgi:arylsulfatase A-like enzyme